MMKNSRKLFLTVVSLLCVAGVAVAITAGMIFITSNVTHVEIQYTVTLSSSVVDSEITLNAEVKNNGNPVGAGINVDFYYSVDGGTNWVYINYQPTDTAGVAQTIYTATANGGYDFRAIATVP